MYESTTRGVKAQKPSGLLHPTSPPSLEMFCPKFQLQSKSSLKLQANLAMAALCYATKGWTQTFPKLLHLSLCRSFLQSSVQFQVQFLFIKVLSQKIMYKSLCRSFLQSSVQFQVTQLHLLHLTPLRYLVYLYHVYYQYLLFISCIVLALQWTIPKISTFQNYFNVQNILPCV